MSQLFLDIPNIRLNAIFQHQKIYSGHIRSSYIKIITFFVLFLFLNFSGMRFGLMQFKTGLAALISNFELSIDPKNEHFDYMKGSLLLQTTKPLILKLKRVSS